MPPSTPKRPTGLHEEASQWVTILHSGAATTAQRRAFARWLNANESHQRAYSEVETFWQSLGSLRQDMGPELAAARAYLRQAQRSRRVFRPGLALAASLLLAVAATPLWRIWLDNGVYRTAKGEQAHIELSDGSRIDLNTDSELQVAYTWTQRKVTLARGEALFSVDHDPEKTFQVAAAKGLIRDIGTRFNVYRQGDRVSVTVLEGEVCVAAQGVAKNLTPNQQVRYDTAGQLSSVVGVDVDAATAWQKRQMLFKGQPLSAVLEELGRYHDVTLQIADKRLRGLKVSGSFPSDNLPLALATMSSALPIKTESPEPGLIVIKSAE